MIQERDIYRRNNQRRHDRRFRGREGRGGGGTEREGRRLMVYTRQNIKKGIPWQ